MNDRERQQRRIAQKLARKKQVRRMQMMLAIGVLAAILLAILAGKGIGSYMEKKKEQEMQQALLEKYQAGADEINGFCTGYMEKNGFSSGNRESDFADWLADEYGAAYCKAMIEKLAAGLTEKDFYELTGKTFIVLADTYLGRLENPENQIYQKAGTREGKVVLSFAGDLCLAEDGFVLDHFDESKGLQGSIDPKVLEKTNHADLFFLNHEYCVSDRGTPLPGKYYTFRANPERMDLVKEMGTDIVSLANNHVYDYGPEAMNDTVDLLQQAGIPYVGGGKNYEEAARPVYFVINGMKIGFVGATRAEKKRYTPEAGEDSPGVLFTYDTEAFNQVIAKADTQCDYLVAYVHWGTEDSNRYETYQQDMAREFFASGAEIIVGGHPHVLQGIEYMEGRPVVYSLGDFWFNHETKDTGLLEVTVSANGLEEMKFVPCKQANFVTRYLDDPEDQRAFFDRLESISPNISIDKHGVISATEDSATA